jgi:hypothetical protein
MAGKANLSVVKGDTFIRNCTFRNKATQVPVDLTGCTISGIAASLPMTCAIVDAVNGKLSFRLSSSQTNAIGKGINKIEVQVTYPDSTVQTIIQGNLVVEIA